MHLQNSNLRQLFCVRWDDNDITHGVVDDRFVLIENKPNAINVFNTKGYIHVIDDVGSFKPAYNDTDIELYTTKRIYVKDIIEIDNVLDELYKYYEIYKYPNRPKKIFKYRQIANNEAIYLYILI